MKTLKLLVCGTRKSTSPSELYKIIVYNGLKAYINDYEQYNIEVIEGCCKNSADEYAENYCMINNIKIIHYPSTSGKYLERNIEMVKDCDEVLAFWNGYSYGTAQTIAQAVLNDKRVRIVKI